MVTKKRAHMSDAEINAEVADLVRKVNEERESWGKRTVEHVMKLGALLDRLVELVPWGSKGDWLEDNVQLHRNTIDRYRYLHKNRTRLEQLCTSLVEIGSLAEAERIIDHAIRKEDKLAGRDKRASGKNHRGTAADAEFRANYDRLPAAGKDAFDCLDKLERSGDADANRLFWQLRWRYRDLGAIVMVLQEWDAREEGHSYAAAAE